VLRGVLQIKLKVNNGLSERLLLLFIMIYFVGGKVGIYRVLVL
jgi:hypothetical protein